MMPPERYGGWALPRLVGCAAGGGGGAGAANAAAGLGFAGDHHYDHSVLFGVALSYSGLFQHPRRAVCLSNICKGGISSTMAITTPQGDDVLMFGLGSMLRRRLSQGRSVEDAVYYEPWKKVDASLKSIGFVPQGTVSRIFILLFAYSGISQALKDAAAAVTWIEQKARCHRDEEELKECLARFAHKMFRALVEDAAGWAPIMFDD